MHDTLDDQIMALFHHLIRALEDYQATHHRRAYPPIRLADLEDPNPPEAPSDLPADIIKDADRYRRLRHKFINSVPGFVAEIFKTLNTKQFDAVVDRAES